MARGKILIVDDEIEVRGFFQAFLEDRDFLVVTAANGEEGFEKFQQEPFDLVISDMLMPRMIGLELLRRIKTAKPDQRVILMTGVKEETMVAKAKALGCQFYITKPVTLADVEAKVVEALQKSSS